MERCHHKTILRALRSGALEGYRVGRDWRVSQAALESYRRNSRGRSAEEVICKHRVALVRAAVNGGGHATLNEVAAETGLRRTVVQDCLRRLGYVWTAGDGPLQKAGA